MTVNYKNDQGLLVCDVSGVKLIEDIAQEFGGTGWVRVIPPPPPTPTVSDLFSVDQFAEDLMGSSLSADSNVLQYYAVIKDLAAFKNFSGMKAMIAGLLSAGKLIQSEVDSLNKVLANQNIVLANF